MRCSVSFFFSLNWSPRELGGGKVGRGSEGRVVW
jgi:hypothetical protein